MVRLSSSTTSILAVGLALVAGCASRATVSDPSSAAARSSITEAESPASLLPEPPNDAIVAIHRSKCGACHARVEPGTVTRATAESAMLRHRRRAKLTERQWEDMVDYLSADGHVHARSTASVP
jgi:hypothetical protein